MKLIVRTCRRCDRPMIPAKRHQSCLRSRYVRAAAHGMCHGCYSTARRAGTLPNPTPPRPRGRERLSEPIIRECRGCGRDMVSKHMRETRPELRARYPHVGAFDMCQTCYYRARRHGTIPNPPPPRDPLDPETLARLRAAVGIEAVPCTSP